MKWGGVNIDTSRIKNSDGSTIESRFQTVESAGGGGGGLQPGRHFLAPITPGRTYTNQLTWNSYTNSYPGQNAVQAQFVIPAQDVTPISLSVNTTSAVAGSLMKIVIYTTTDYYTYNILDYSPDFDTSRAGLKTWNFGQTLRASNIYAIGVISSVNNTNTTGIQMAYTPSIHYFGGGNMQGVLYYIYSYTVPESFVQYNYGSALSTCPAIFFNF